MKVKSRSKERTRLDAASSLCYNAAASVVIPDVSIAVRIIGAFAFGSVKTIPALYPVNKIDNITELFYAFYEAGRYPVTIYRGVVRVLLTFVVPIAFITTFPASALLGRIDPTTTIIGFAFAIGSFIVSNRFWRFALRYYSSASS